MNINRCCVIDPKTIKLLFFEATSKQEVSLSIFVVKSYLVFFSFVRLFVRSCRIEKNSIFVASGEIVSLLLHLKLELKVTRLLYLTVQSHPTQRSCGSSLR